MSTEHERETLKKVVGLLAKQKLFSSMLYAIFSHFFAFSEQLQPPLLSHNF